MLSISLLISLSVSTLSRISSACPNIELWYALAQSSSSYNANLYSSASSISELGSVIGKSPSRLINCLNLIRTKSIIKHWLKVAFLNQIFLKSQQIQCPQSVNMSGISCQLLRSTHWRRHNSRAWLQHKWAKLWTHLTTIPSRVRSKHTVNLWRILHEVLILLIQTLAEPVTVEPVTMDRLSLHSAPLISFWVWSVFL